MDIQGRGAAGTYRRARIGSSNGGAGLFGGLERGDGQTNAPDFAAVKYAGGREARTGALRFRAVVGPTPADAARTVLLTGGTGVMGWRLATAFAAASFDVHLLVRKQSRKGLRERVSALRTEQPDVADRMRLFTGDLLDPALTDDEGRERLLAECDGIVHAACERRSDKPRDRVFDTNLGGTRALLELLDGMERSTKRFLHISDLSVAGDRGGVFFEGDLLVGQDFGDDCASESRLLAERRVHASKARATVLRLAHPLVARGDEGRIPDPLAARRRWRPARRGEPRWVHALPAGWMAEVVLAAWDDAGCVGRTLHVADPCAPWAREVGVPADVAERLPASRCRVDTTETDRLLRARALRRPGLGDLLAALKPAG